VFEGPLRAAAVLVSAIIVVSWALFVVDELRSASNHQLAEVVAPSATERAKRDRGHGTVRRAIDRADDVVLAPFAWVTQDSGSTWARRTVPAVLGLLVWGVGGAFLARFARGRA
jgi:hypothetical protein